MAGFRHEGLSGRVSEVDANNNWIGTLQPTLANAGAMGMGAIVHDGASGATRVFRPAEISVSRRLISGMDSLWFQDVFNYTSQYSAVWQAFNTGTATTWGTGGFVVLNSGNATGAVSSQITTYKMFPLYDGVSIQIEFDIILPQATDATTSIEFGLFQATGTANPTDGVFFRILNNVLYGVSNWNGTEQGVSLGTPPAVNTEHEFMMNIQTDYIEFWMDGVLLNVINVNNTADQSMLSLWQPINVRTYGVSTTVASIKVGAIRLFTLDIPLNRPWAQTMAGMGLMGSQAPQGATQGSTAYMANNLAVGTGVALANATQATYVGLGGQFDVQPTLTANNDGILCYYQVPSGTASVPGKSLVITGIKIQSAVTTTLVNAAPLYLVYSLAYGATALSLATTESATAKAYRRVPIGVETYSAVNAAQGTQGVVGGTSTAGLLHVPSSPIVVNQGEYVTIAVKNTGTVTTGGVITVLVTFDAHWE